MTRKDASEDAISRQAVLDALESIGSFDTETDKQYARSIFEALPSVKSQPKIGRWINKKCSACGCRSMLGLCIENYCANCGAKMQEEVKK